jgi:hypothetical protein
VPSTAETNSKYRAINVEIYTHTHTHTNVKEERREM